MDAMTMTAAPPDRSLGRAMKMSLPAIAVALLAGGGCFAATGATLGLFLGGALLATIVAAPMLAAVPRRFDQVCIAGGIVDAFGAVWLIAAIRSDISFVQWLECYVLLASVVAALAGLTAILHCLTRSDLAAGALALLLMLAWMTWPIWLSPWLSRAAGADRAVSLLTPAHPMLALNGVLIDRGVWGEQRLAYQLTVLGQDVPYSLPARVWPAVLLHLLIGCGLLLPVGGGVRRGPVGLAIDDRNRG